MSKIEVKEGLNKDNIIQKIQEELKKQNQVLYEEWKKNGFDVNYVFNSPLSSMKFTLLTIAAQNGYANIVKILLEKGANVHEKVYLDMTPLHLAACSGHEKTVEVLIQAGANVNAVDEYGKTTLDHAKEYTKKCAEGYAKGKNAIKVLLNEEGGSFLKASRKGKIAGGVTILLGTAIAVALFTTGTIAAQLIPIVIAVVAVTTAALVVGYATYELLKPSTKVGEVEKPIVNLTNEQQGVTGISSY